jgi:RNA methyltransferase, TrmH family
VTDVDITSVRNDRVKAVAALHRKKERDATGLYLVEGPNAVGEALVDGAVEDVYVTDDLADRYLDLEVGVTVVAEHVMEKLSDARSPQGVVAVARRRAAPLEDVLGHGFVVVLHEVADPGNAGAIIRTADAAGAAGVVLSTGSVDPWNPKAVRAAAGSLTHLDLVVDVDTEDVIDACRAVGQRIIGLDAGGHVDVDDPDATAPPVALVFGAEAHGLPDRILDRLDLVVAVPRYGRAESLNLAAAVAVTTFAVARRVHGRPPTADPHE